MDTVIRLSTEVHGEAELELFLNFTSRGYSGRGSAWFYLPKLKEQIERFADYPILAASPPCIEGGLVDEIRLHLSLSPLTATGVLGLQIKVAESYSSMNVTGIGYSATALIEISYEHAAALARGLTSLVKGNISEFIFNPKD